MFCWNLKWPLLIKFIFFDVAKTQKFQVYNHIPHDIEILWFCDFFRVLREFKMAAMHELHNFGGRKNSKIEVRNNVQKIVLKFKMATATF